MFLIKNNTARLTVKHQQIIVIPKSASTLRIQYNDGTTQPFEGNQRQVEWDGGDGGERGLCERCWGN